MKAILLIIFLQGLLVACFPGGQCGCGEPFVSRANVYEATSSSTIEITINEYEVGSKVELLWATVAKSDNPNEYMRFDLSDNK